MRAHPTVLMSKWKHGGDFDSISLATRQIIQLEKLDSPTLELLVTVWTEFMDDDDAISHYTHTTPLCKYADPEAGSKAQERNCLVSSGPGRGYASCGAEFAEFPIARHRRI